MKSALFLHLTFVSVWLGCILVEAIYEHSIDKSDGMRVFISRLHWTTDKYVEIPAFLGVLASGGYMMPHSTLTPLLWVKVVFGLIAIAFNAICVSLVIRRIACARAGDFARWEALDRKQHIYGAVVLISLLIALFIGGHVFATA